MKLLKYLFLLFPACAIAQQNSPVNASRFRLYPTVSTPFNNDNALTQVLVWDPTSKEFKWRSASSIAGVGDFWKTSGTTSLIGNSIISGVGSYNVLFNNLTSFEVNANTTGFLSIGGNASASIGQNDGVNSSLLDLNSGTASLNCTGDMTFNPVGGVSFLPTSFNVTGTGALTFSTTHAGGFNVTTSTGPIQFIPGSYLQLSSFTIESDGSWNINSSNGSSGQVLTSNGASASPSWQSAPAPSLNSTFVPYGDGSNLQTSSSNLTYTNASELLQVGGSDGIRIQGVANNITSLGSTFDITGLSSGVTGGTVSVSGGTGSTTGGNLYLSGGTGGTTNGKVGVQTTSPQSGFDINTSMGWKVNTVTGTTTLGNHNVVFADATGGSFTLNLPAVASSTGRIYTILKTNGTNTVTLDGNASETINGVTTYPISTQYERLIIACDGSAWYVIGD